MEVVNVEVGVASFSGTEVKSLNEFFPHFHGCVCETLGINGSARSFLLRKLFSGLTRKDLAPVGRFSLHICLRFIHFPDRKTSRNCSQDSTSAI